MSKNSNLDALVEKFGRKYPNRKALTVVSPDTNGMTNTRRIGGKVDWDKQDKLQRNVGSANVQAGVPTRGVAIPGAGRPKNKRK